MDFFMLMYVQMPEFSYVLSLSHVVSSVWCGTWLCRFLIFAFLLTLNSQSYLKLSQKHPSDTNNNFFKFLFKIHHFFIKKIKLFYNSPIKIDICNQNNIGLK